MKPILEYIQKKHMGYDFTKFDNLFTNQTPDAKYAYDIMNVFYNADNCYDNEAEEYNYYISYDDLYTISINDLINYIHYIINKIEKEQKCKIEEVTFCACEDLIYYAAYRMDVETNKIENTNYQIEGSEKIDKYFSKHVSK